MITQDSDHLKVIYPMTDSEIICNRIVETGVVAVMRGAFAPEAALAVTGVLLEEQINVFELTMNSDEPIAALHALKTNYGDRAFCGMGTVLSVDEAKQVMDAGGDFVVSPAFDPAVVKYVVDAGTLMIPGVITPSEAVAAWNMGVPLLKLFPIGALGLTYFKSVFGPLNHMKFMCNGAINQENARAFIQAGAVACGMAGWLTGDGTTPLETVRARAGMIKAAISQGRTQV